jgi:parallel beta-helix repeat protein
MERQRATVRIVQALFCIIGLIALCSAPAMAATITVCSSGCNYTSIQEAIDHAADGDTIAVMNGTYYERIIIDKPLTLQGESPEGTAIIGSHVGTVANITADDVVVTGFSISGGGMPVGEKDYPAGIGTNGTSTIMISQCRVTDCYIGIYANATTGVTVTENELFNNNLTGIELLNSDLARVTANAVHDNFQGLLLGTTNGIECSENTVYHNMLNGLYIIEAISDSVIEDNLVQDNCYVDFDDAGDDSQAGAYIENIENLTIRNNRFIHNGGLALFLSGMDSSVLEGNIMEDNFAGFSYNGIPPDPGNSIDTSNTIDGLPILYVEDASGQEITGGGIATLYCVSCEDMVIHDLLLTQRNGFGIFVSGGSGISAVNNTVENNVFQNILFAQAKASAITGNLVKNGMYGSGVLNGLNVTVSGNTATGNRKGLAAAGAAVDVHFTGNTVSGNGVGISFEDANGVATGISRNVIQGDGSKEDDVGISFSASRNIHADDNAINGLFEGVWIYGGEFNTVSNSSIDDCRFGIEISLIGGVEPTPASNNTITGNEVATERLAFLINGPEAVYGNHVYLNNFSSQEDPGMMQDTGNLVVREREPFSWGLHRLARLSPGTPAPAAPEFEPNVFHTDTPVVYKYQDLYFNGYLGNHWNWYNGTDSDGNGVGTTPYPVFMNNTDDYPLVAPVSAYTVGPVPPFYADFTASPGEGSAPLTVQFTDASNGTPLLWLYNFGDGFTSNAKNPRHTYRTPGDYTVSLTIRKLEGQTLVDTTTRKPAFITVTGTPAPVLSANFTAVPVSGQAPLTVTFTDTSTGDPDYWSYDFGDGSTSSAKNPSHTYRAAGTYTVTLTVIKIGSGGLTRDTTVKQDLITVTGTPAPVLAANFTAAPLTGPSPLTVTFTDTSTGDPDFWTYDFGDGTTSSSKNPSHTYRAAGTYTVTLTIMKISGGGFIRDTTVKQDLVTVTGSPAPVLAANFTAVPVAGPAPLTVTFTDTSTGDPQFWNYGFGDGTSSTAKNPSHTYRWPGNYTVTLTILKPEGSTLVRDTITRPNLISVG